MELTIKLDKDDWLRFQSYLEREMPKKVKLWSNSLGFYFFIMLIAAIAVLSILQGADELHWPTAILVSSFFVITFVLFIYNLTKMKDAYAPSEDGVFVGEHHFVLDEEGIKSNGTGYERRHSWTLVRQVDRGNGLIMVFLDTAYAYIFPESKLENPDELYKYIAEQCRGGGNR